MDRAFYVVAKVLQCGCYVVAKVPKSVARVLLCGCYGTRGGLKFKIVLQR